MGGVSMEWKEVTLGDLCEISSSKRIFAKEYQSDGVPFYRGKEIIAKQKGNAISNELFISRNRYEEIKARYGVPQQRELLLTSVGTLGVPYVIKEEEFYFKDGNLTWFRHFNGLDVEYLYYWFLSPYGKNEINTKAIGSTQKALTIDSLSKFDIKIPANLDDQRRIASILSSLDRKIELNNKINADLEEMAQAIFKNWFVDFEPFKGGKFVDSELGMIPEGWKVGRADDFYQINIGKTPPRKENKWFSTNPADKIWVSIANMGNSGIFISDSSEYLTKEAVDRHNIIMVPRNTILLSFKLTVGRVAIADKELTTNEAIARFILSDDKYMEYLYLYLKNFDYNSLGSTSSIATAVNSKTIKGMQMLQPSDKIIDAFHIQVNPIFEKIRSLTKENSRLSLLRDTLLPRLMSGELEVPE